ncbi:MAG: capsid assembly protein [Candidatus Thorarchaeota archaeon]|jgi:hypothetical protein
MGDTINPQATGGVEAFDPNNLDDFKSTQVDPNAGEPQIHNGKQSMQINVNPTDPNANPAVDPATQNLIAGKYKSQEDFDKAILEAFKKKHGDNLVDGYNSLQGDLSPNAENQAVAQTDNTQTPDNTPDPIDPTIQTPEDLNAGPVDLTPHMDDFVSEFTNDGQLSTDSYGILEKAGYDKTMVDTYMTGVMAQRDSLFGRVGGQDQFFQLTEWAGKGGLTKAEVQQFNDDIGSNDLGRMANAIDNLSVKFRNAGMQTAPNRMQPTNINQTPGVQGYTHIDQLKKDQADPRYKTDGAFRNEVMEKLRRGSI